MQSMPKLVYMPEESTPTIATEDNREAIAYLELGEHTDYYGRLFAASQKLLEAAILAEDILSELARLDDGTPSVSALEDLRAAIAEVAGGAG